MVNGVVSGLASLVSPTRVGVVVYPRMAGELVRTGELLAATRVLAGVRLLASVRTNMPGLMLETVKSLVTKWALVRTRQLVCGLCGLAARKRAVWPDDGDRSHTRVSVSVGLVVGGVALGSVGQLGRGRRGVWVQQVGKIHR